MSFRLDPHGSPRGEVMTAMLEQIVKTGELLVSAFDDPHKGLHESRKRIKRIRALLALMRKADRGFYQAEDRRWRDTSRLLSGPREASALVETVDRFIAEFPEANRAGELDEIRATLDRQRQSIGSDADSLRPAIGAAILSCAEAGEAVRDWHLPDEPREAARIFASGVKRSWKDAETAAALAARRGRADDFHDLRKAVKRHSAHLAYLRAIWPGDAGARRKAVDRLADRLGELNDIAVMSKLVEDGGVPIADPLRLTFFGELLNEKRRTLEAEAVDLADDLFSERPERLRRRFRDALEDAMLAQV
jgi:CHAD domain-containing protein